ncbi:MAG: TVP38/TMEM64 family protein [Cyanobacteria bacterium P01_C01_bin.72]
MFKLKYHFLILLFLGAIFTVIGVVIIKDIEQQQLEMWLEQTGLVAPLIYIVLYTIGTLLILPSTPLNMTGGAIFGIWWGTLWTTIAALVAAISAFVFTRTVGRELVSQKLGERWRAMDREIAQGGFFYLLAIRLLPLIPYGIVNFGAGLTAIKFKDYAIATLLGTLPGIFPFVMLGAGITSLSEENLLPLMGALSLIGILLGGATWYRRRNS